MADVGPPGAQAALPSFAETNLRTYVRERGGRDGPWFLPLEVSCPVMPAARAIGAPYVLGHLTLSRDGEVVTYTGGTGAWRAVVSRGGPSGRAAPSEPAGRVADVAVAGLHTGLRRTLADARRARAWPLLAAQLEDIEETVTPAAALPPPAQEPLVRFSDDEYHASEQWPCPHSAAGLARHTLDTIVPVRRHDGVVRVVREADAAVQPWAIPVPCKS
ncbi:DUF2071 domain-containing protein [Streptomyces sp. NPDC002092]